MKKFILALIAIAASLFFTLDEANAQRRYVDTNAPHDNRIIISTRPISLITLQPNAKFEYAFNNFLSGGLHFSYFTVLNKGPKFDPFLRIYPGADKSAPEGFFVQVKGSYGRHDKMLDDLEIVQDLKEELIDRLINEIGSDEVEQYVDELILDEKQQANFTAWGGGVTAGYQWLLGNNDNIALDLYGGFKRYKTNFKNSNIGDAKVFNTLRSFPLEIGFQVGIAF